MKPSVDLLTSVVERFAKEEVYPRVQSYLRAQGKDGSSLFLPNSDVPRDVYRLVQLAVEDPLMIELENFSPGSKAPPVKQVKIEIRTSADVVSAAFVPVQYHGHGHSHARSSTALSKPDHETSLRLSNRQQEVRTNHTAYFASCACDVNPTL
jgi:hypothetical protein